MRSLKKIKRSKDGGMPFVAIAAVLLILGSAYGVMISQAKDIEETADNIITELGSLDSAIVGTKTSVERGLGELIFGISTDPEGGSLENRAEMFKKQSGEWMRKNFPCADKGVSVSIKDFDFVLEAENLKMVSSDAFTDGFMPSYLKAAGHYTATFVSGSGTVQRVTEISTDGTCALPLVAEVGSLFESMVSDEGSALSQMMSHQLTSLAQYRVLNGYGALAEYGSMGTMSIITSDDVRAAYESSKRVLEMLVFRCPSDGIDADLEKIDLADMFVSEDGFIEIDLSAVYSQALISIIDDLVLRWFDYFYGNTIIDIFDFFTDAFGNFLDSLVGFFTGKNEFTAAPYIERVMSDNGLDMNLYRHLFSGKTASIRTDSIDLIVGNSSVTVPSLTVSVDYPSVDLMAWGGISKFKSNYREDTNDIRELIRNIINSAAVGIGTSKALGTIRLPIDPSDDVSFMESLFDGVDAALDRGRSEVERFMTSAINEQRISDPFYAAIFKVVSEDREHIYCAGIFKENIRSSITASLALHFENCGIVYDENDLDKAAAVLLGGDDVRRTISFYDEAVEGCLSGLSALTEVPAGRSGTFKDICIAMFGGGALFVDFATNVPAKIRALCAEAVKNSNINGYSGPVDLPGTDSFILAGSGGKVSTEKLSISSSSAPKIQVRGPGDNLSDCIHYIGFNEVNGASHATAFSVSLEDDLEYTLRSSGILETAMDVSDSVYKGSAKIRLNIKIVVASGWELAGVKKYTPSNTALGDAWNALIKLMFPLLEPLREILMMMTDVFTILCGPMMEMLKCVASIVEKLFRAMMEPLEVMKRFVEEQLEKVFNFAVEKAIEGVEWIVGIDMSKQTVGFSYMGFTVTFTTKLSTLASNTKTLIIVTISKEMDNVTISGSLTVKQRGSGSSKELLLTGSATIKGSDWSVSADIDPLMKSSGQMLFVYGYVKGVSFDLIFPDLVQYQHAEFALSDIPPIAMVLSNIPSPIPGFKISLDAGIDLKYNIPFKGGILINEFELNPPGEDRDNEWVEVINMTKSRVDLDGYTIHAGSNPQTKVYTIKNVTLSPGQREVFTMPGAFLNNSGSALMPEGECVILRSPDGKEVDRTPAKKDTANDSRTWQRVADGAIDWVFAEGTPGASNCGGLFGGEMVKLQIINILKNSAVKVMGDMKSLKSTEDLADFFQAAIRHAIDTGIEMLAACLVEASIFVSIEFQDDASLSCAGFRIALSIDSGFIEEGLKYLVGEIEAILFNVENPYGLKPKEVLTDNLYLGVTFYTGIASPWFLKNIDAYPSVKLGVHVSTNVSALCRVIGADIGKWKVTAGVIIMDCPTILVPSMLKPKMTLDSDLWVMRATFTPA